LAAKNGAEQSDVIPEISEDDVSDPLTIEVMRIEEDDVKVIDIKIERLGLHSLVHIGV
jgi:hypothetical protein